MDEIIKLEGHVYSVISLSFNHEGSLLASGSVDKTIIIWETKNYTKIN